VHVQVENAQTPLKTLQLLPKQHSLISAFGGPFGMVNELNLFVTPAKMPVWADILAALRIT
jgi:hypothetical protein